MRRYSLRTLLIGMAVVAVLCVLPIRRAMVQKRGRDWVASQNGHVSFSHQYNAETKEWDHDATLPLPDWMVTLFGIDFFDTVDSVILDNTEVKDLLPIRDLQGLRTLAIFIEVDDQLDFSPLARLPRLRHIYLNYTGISAERLAQLRDLLPHVHVHSANHTPQ